MYTQLLRTQRPRPPAYFSSPAQTAGEVHKQNPCKTCFGASGRCSKASFHGSPCNTAARLQSKQCKLFPFKFHSRSHAIRRFRSWFIHSYNFHPTPYEGVIQRATNWSLIVAILSMRCHATRLERVETSIMLNLALTRLQVIRWHPIGWLFGCNIYFSVKCIIRFQAEMLRN